MNNNLLKKPVVLCEYLFDFVCLIRASFLWGEYKKRGLACQENRGHKMCGAESMPVQSKHRLLRTERKYIRQR